MIGLMLSCSFLLFIGSLLLLLFGAFGGALLATIGAVSKTSGGCFVSSHEISGSSCARISTSSSRFIASRASRSSSLMYELAWLPQKEDSGDSMVRFGQSGCEQLTKDELLSDEGGARGERSFDDSDGSEEVDDREDTGERSKSEEGEEEELIDGGESPDLKGLFIALENAIDGKGLRDLESAERDMLSHSS